MIYPNSESRMMNRRIWLWIEIAAGILFFVLLGFFVLRKVEDYRFVQRQRELSASIQRVQVAEEPDSERLTKDLESSEIELDSPGQDPEQKARNRQKTRSEEARQQVERLREAYPAVIAIIEIPGTEVLFPVVQGQDNEYYLTHDKEGAYHPYGEVFLDYRNKPDFSEQHSIIYGHNIRSAKAIFNELMEYSDQAFYEAHPQINIYTTDGLKGYQIVSVFRADPEEPYREIQWDSDAEYQEFTAHYFSQSIIQPKPYQPNSLLTISTCFDDEIRFVIMAVEK